MTEAKKHTKPGKDVVYLDVDDDITTIVDKVEAAKNKVVALVLPKRYATLQSIVNMRLLKRSSDSAGKNIVLITSDHSLLPLAGAAGIHAAKNLQSRPAIPPSPVDMPKDKPPIPTDPDAEIDEKDAKLDYHRSIGVLAAAHATDEPEAITLEDEDDGKPAKKPAKAHKDKKLKVPDFDRFRLMLFGGIGAAVLLLLFLIMALFVWPKATVTLQTEATPLSTTFNLTTSSTAKALDETKQVIPGALKTSDLNSSQQVQATGQQNNGQKASGSVSMTAQKCAGNPFDLPGDVPAGTGLSSGGLNYVTQANVSFHGTGISGGCYNYAGNSSTSIVSQSAGSKYNVSGATFSVQGRSDVSASGSASGGTDNIVTVISQSDVDSAKSKISDSDKNKFAEDFKKQISDQGFYLIGTTFKSNDPVVTASPAVGQQASTSNVSIKITYSGLVVPKSDLKTAVTNQLNKEIDQKKQKIGTDDVLKNLSVDVQSQPNPTTAVLAISQNTTAIPIIDVAAVSKQVAGLKVGDIKSMLSSYPGVKNVDVKLSPFWVSKAPKKTSHIVIVQQQVKKDSSEN